MDDSPSESPSGAPSVSPFATPTVTHPPVPILYSPPFGRRLEQVTEPVSLVLYVCVAALFVVTVTVFCLQRNQWQSSNQPPVALQQSIDEWRQAQNVVSYRNRCWMYIANLLLLWCCYFALAATVLASFICDFVKDSNGDRYYGVWSYTDSSSSSSSSTARHRKLQTQPASGGSRTANQNVWKAHGILMTAAWAIIIPLAVTTSLVRELLSDGSWFYIHRFLNSLAVLCVVTAFVLAFYAIHQEDDQSHFRKTDHRAIGVSALFLVMIQAILGYARPQREIEAIEAGVVVADEAKTSPQPQPQPTPEDGIVPNTTDPERKEKAADKEDDDEAIELTDLRKLWSLQHRLLGFCLVGVCWYNIHRGIVLYEDRFGDILTDRSTTAIFWGGMIGFVISVFVLVTVVRSFT
mmetsp:Transcript_13579/g.25922  ORF Transcript_13579/g.25922 Transcript_13579/m.25922 type:complete len:407 (+) Transcript_13579:163-1383(+)